MSGINNQNCKHSTFIKEFLLSCEKDTAEGIWTTLLGLKTAYESFKSAILIQGISKGITKPKKQKTNKPASIMNGNQGNKNLDIVCKNIDELNDEGKELAIALFSIATFKFLAIDATENKFLRGHAAVYKSLVSGLKRENGFNIMTIMPEDIVRKARECAENDTQDPGEDLYIMNRIEGGRISFPTYAFKPNPDGTDKKVKYELFGKEFIIATKILDQETNLFDNISTITPRPIESPQVSHLLQGGEEEEDYYSLYENFDKLGQHSKEVIKMIKALSYGDTKRSIDEIIAKIKEAHKFAKAVHNSVEQASNEIDIAKPVWASRQELLKNIDSMTRSIGNLRSAPDTIEILKTLANELSVIEILHHSSLRQKRFAKAITKAQEDIKDLIDDDKLAKGFPIFDNYFSGTWIEWVQTLDEDMLDMLFEDLEHIAMDDLADIIDYTEGFTNNLVRKNISTVLAFELEDFSEELAQIDELGGWKIDKRAFSSVYNFVTAMDTFKQQAEEISIIEQFDVDSIGKGAFEFYINKHLKWPEEVSDEVHDELENLSKKMAEKIIDICGKTILTVKKEGKKLFFNFKTIDEFATIFEKSQPPEVANMLSDCNTEAGIEKLKSFIFEEMLKYHKIDKLDNTIAESSMAYITKVRDKIFLNLMISTPPDPQKCSVPKNPPTRSMVSQFTSKDNLRQKNTVQAEESPRADEPKKKEPQATDEPIEVKAEDCNNIAKFEPIEIKVEDSNCTTTSEAIEFNPDELKDMETKDVAKSLSTISSDVKRSRILVVLIEKLVADKKFDVALELEKSRMAAFGEDQSSIPLWVLEYLYKGYSFKGGQSQTCEDLQYQYMLAEEDLANGVKLPSNIAKIAIAALVNPLIVKPYATSAQSLLAAILGTSTGHVGPKTQEIMRAMEHFATMTCDSFRFEQLAPKDGINIDKELGAIKTRARQNIERNSKMNVGKIQPLINAWKEWFNPGKMPIFHEALDAVINDDKSKINLVKDRVKVIESDEKLKDLVLSSTKDSYMEKVQTFMLQSLKLNLDETCSILKQWLYLTEFTDNNGQRNYIEEAVTELKNSIKKLTPDVLKELAAKTTGDQILAEKLAWVNSTFSDGYTEIEGSTSSSDFLALAPGTIDTENGDFSYENIIDYILEPMSADVAVSKYVKIGNMALAGKIAESRPEDQKIQAEFTQGMVQWLKTVEKNTLQLQRMKIHVLSLCDMPSSTSDEFDEIISNIATKVKESKRFDFFLVKVEKTKSTLQSIIDSCGEDIKKSLREIENISDCDKEKIEKAISENRLRIANEYINRLRTNGAIDVGQTNSESTIFFDFFVGDDAPSNTLAKRYAGLNDGTRFMDDLAKRKRFLANWLKNADIGEINKRKILVSKWQTLQKSVKNSFRTADVEEFFREMGFDSTTVQDSNLYCSTIKCTPIADPEVCPIHIFGSSAQGRYKVFHFSHQFIQTNGQQKAEEIIKSNSTSNDAIIILYTGALNSAEKWKWLGRLRQDIGRAIMIDSTLLYYIATRQESHMKALFNAALPFAKLQPYSTLSGFSCPEAFFGRKEEIQKILSKHDGGNLIYGGRQLGKSCLLKEVVNNYQEDDLKIFYLDIKKKLTNANKIWDLIAAPMKEQCVISERAKTPKRYCQDIKSFIDSNNCRIIFLIDEADDFFKMDAANGMAEVERFADLMNSTSFKVIFSGTHNTLKMTSTPNSRLAHMGLGICIGPFIRPDEIQAGEDMIRVPFKAMGYELSDDALVSILAQTNSYPSLIQLFCYELMKYLTKNHTEIFLDKAPVWEITIDHINAICHPKSGVETPIFETMKDRFARTLHLAGRYHLCALIIAAETHSRGGAFNGLKISEITERALAFWPAGMRDMRHPSLMSNVLQEMIGLGILRKKDDKYLLRSSNMLPLFESRESIDQMLKNANDFLQLPEPFDPSVDRSNIKPGIVSPLTLNQSQHFELCQNEVIVWHSCDMLDQKSLGKALSTIHLDNLDIVPKTCQNKTSFKQFLDTKLQKRPAGQTVILVPAENKWNAEWVNYACSKIGALHSNKDKYAAVCFVSTPATDMNTNFNESCLHLYQQKWTKNIFDGWVTDKGLSKAQADEIASVYSGWPAIAYELAKGEKSLDDIIKGLKPDLGIGKGFEREILRTLKQWGSIASEDFDEVFTDLNKTFNKTADELLSSIEWLSNNHFAIEEPQPGRVGVEWQIDPIIERIV